MSGDSVYTSESISWTPSAGEETTYTVESFQSYPDIPNGAKNIQRSHEDGKYVSRYTLLTGGADATYTITGGVSQEPIGTHPMFGSDGGYGIEDDEWKKWKLWETDPRDPDLAGWKPDGDDASTGMKKYYAYRNRGIDDYLLGTVTMRVSQEGQSGPDLGGIGRIQSPPGAPSLPDGRNWLLVGVDAERVGSSTWKVTREYRASGAGGWDREIYNRT
jgi:hypothetical protein